MRSIEPFEVVDTHEDANVFLLRFRAPDDEAEQFFLDLLIRSALSPCKVSPSRKYFLDETSTPLYRYEVLIEGEDYAPIVQIMEALWLGASRRPRPSTTAAPVPLRSSAPHVSTAQVQAAEVPARRPGIKKDNNGRDIYEEVYPSGKVIYRPSAVKSVRVFGDGDNETVVISYPAATMINRVPILEPKSIQEATSTKLQPGAVYAHRHGGSGSSSLLLGE